MLLIIAAVPLETALLRQQLQESQARELHGHLTHSGILHGQSLLIAHGGVGQNAMAIRLSRLLSQLEPQAVLLCGCGGSYPDSGLQIGDLALASEEICGDLGVATGDGFIPLEQLEIAQQPELMPSIQHRFPLQSQWTDFARQVLPHARFGPFVTVNSCSGHSALSTELQTRTSGICENMEGAAAAQACAAFNIPLVELRGISNPTGTRAPEQWDIPRGAAAAQAGLLELLRHWPKTQD